MQRETKLYPTPEQYRYSNDAEVPLDGAIDYLTTLRGTLPEAERPSAVLRGWQAVSVHYLHTLTEAEYFAFKLDGIREALSAYKQADGSVGRQGIEAIVALIGP